MGLMTTTIFARRCRSGRRPLHRRTLEKLLGQAPNLLRFCALTQRYVLRERLGVKRASWKLDLPQIRSKNRQHDAHPLRRGGRVMERGLIFVALLGVCCVGHAPASRRLRNRRRIRWRPVSRRKGRRNRQLLFSSLGRKAGWVSRKPAFGVSHRPAALPAHELPVGLSAGRLSEEDGGVFRGAAAAPASTG